jgi:diphthine synthase
LLNFVGLGVDRSLSLKSLDVLRQCDEIFFETYTSPPPDNDPLEKEISSATNGKIVRKVGRAFVESGSEILAAASTKKVALLSSGDPMVATTHQELRTRATQRGVATRVIHGSSILCSLPGELGLHSYNFGRSVTLTSDPIQYTAYEAIFKNLLQGLHTTLLLEWDLSKNFFLGPSAAVQKLMDSEADLKYGIIKSETLVLVASRIGRDNSKIAAATAKEIERTDFGEPPHTLVIPGHLHFTEREALAAMTGKDGNWFADNASAVQRLSVLMVEKYAKKTEEALARAKAALKPTEKNGALDYEGVFENVELYTKDGLRFLREGKDELAVLSVGYAEGLLDSLRFLGLLEFEW